MLVDLIQQLSSQHIWVAKNVISLVKDVRKEAFSKIYTTQSAGEQNQGEIQGLKEKNEFLLCEYDKLKS